MTINRRTVIAAPLFAGAVATVATVETANAAPNAMIALIDAHQASWKHFGKVCDKLSSKEDAYDAFVKANGGKPLVFKSLGGALELRNDPDTLKQDITAEYFRARERLHFLAKITPELAEQAREALDQAAAKDLLAVDTAYENEAQRRQKFGLTAVRKAWEAADEASHAALMAICAYRCQTAEEYRMKGAYLLREDIADSMEGNEVAFNEALARSLA